MAHISRVLSGLVPMFLSFSLVAAPGDDENENYSKSSSPASPMSSASAPSQKIASSTSPEAASSSSQVPIASGSQDNVLTTAHKNKVSSLQEAASSSLQEVASSSLQGVASSSLQELVTVGSVSHELIPVVSASQAPVPAVSTDVEGIFVDHISFDINPLRQDLLLGRIIFYIARDKGPIQLETVDKDYKRPIQLETIDKDHKGCTGKGTICSVHALKNLRLVCRRFNTFIMHSIINPGKFPDEPRLAEVYLSKYPYTFGNQGLTLDNMTVELSRAYWRNWRGAFIQTHKERVFKRIAFEDDDVWAYALNEGQDGDTYMDSHTRHSLYEDDFNALRVLPREAREVDLSSRAISILPPEIGLFRSVEKLNLRLNAFPFLPQTVGDLSNLKQLDVSFCDLKALPGSLRKLQKLEVLNIAGNKLTKLPSWLADMSNLQQFFMMLNPLDEFFESIGFDPYHDEISVLGHKCSPSCIFTCKFQMGRVPVGNLTALQAALKNLPALRAALKNNLGKI